MASIILTIGASLRRMPCKFCTGHLWPASSRELCNRCRRNYNHLVGTLRFRCISRTFLSCWRHCRCLAAVAAERLERCRPFSMLDASSELGGIGWRVAAGAGGRGSVVRCPTKYRRTKNGYVCVRTCTDRNFFFPLHTHTHNIPLVLQHSSLTDIIYYIEIAYLSLPLCSSLLFIWAR